VTADGQLARQSNTDPHSGTGEYAGIGFATTANLVRRVVEGAWGDGMKPPWIGAGRPPVTGAHRTSDGLSRPAASAHQGC